MRTGAKQSSGRIAAAFVCAFAAAPASAQEFPVSPPDTAVSPAAIDGLEAAPGGELSAEDSALLGQALLFDPIDLAGRAPVKPLRLPDLSSPPALDVMRSNRPDGSSSVVVKKPLATEWDAKVGADLDLAANAPVTYSLDNPLRPAPTGGGSGAAWASLNVPHLATVDARVDPVNERGKLGTTFTRSIPLGSTFAVTLQSSYSVSEMFGPPQTAPANVPLAAAPAAAASEPQPHVWGNTNTARFNILPTGTTLAAGLSSSSIDPVTHNTLSAEQKLYGPLHVTTAVTDLGQAGESKSFSARFKLNW
jgi:hypothetical protein